MRRALRSDIPAIAALQRAAFAPLKARIGLSLEPHDADFTAVFDTTEIWVLDGAAKLDAVLILAHRPDHLLIWSIAVSPSRKGTRLGTNMLDFAEKRAAEAGYGSVRLYTNQRFTENIAWYQRKGYGIDRVEERPDRVVVHFVKPLAAV
jgi:ribosomal protein S18 acetylase RimI-like enzyme